MECGEVVLRRSMKEPEHNADYAPPVRQRLAGVDRGDKANLKKRS
jgi:hypothetical protein